MHGTMKRVGAAPPVRDGGTKRASSIMRLTKNSGNDRVIDERCETLNPPSSLDRAFRNRLQLRWFAGECAAWVTKKVELRGAPASLPQSIFIAGKPDSERHRVITGNCAFTTEGLGFTPGNQFSLSQSSEKPEESSILGSFFTSLWNTLPASAEQKTAFLSRLQELADSKAPSLMTCATRKARRSSAAKRTSRRSPSRKTLHGLSKPETLKTYWRRART